MAKGLVKVLESQRAVLDGDRSSWLPLWKECGEYLLPWNTRFNTTETNRGDRRGQKVVDPAGTTALTTLSHGLVSGVTSPTRPWFMLGTPDPALNSYRSVKAWLESVRDLVLEVFLRSNLYTVLPTAYRDVGGFGVTAFAVVEDEEDIIRCYHYPIGSYSLGVSHRGVVDTCFREFKMTVGQMADRFGKDKLSIGSQNLLEQKPNSWVDVVHAVVPNPEKDPAKLEATKKAFLSVYYEKAGNEGNTLAESGFDEFPIMAPRWTTIGEDIYGSECPGFVALGLVKGLQELQRKKLKALAKQIDPALQAPSAMKRRVISLLPSDISYHDSSTTPDPIRPIHQVNTNLADVSNEIADTRRAIQRIFFEDLFMMISQSDRREITAYEIQVRQEEKILALGPVLERLNDEMLDPLISRTVSILERRGMIPPLPPELVGIPINIEYTSILSQARKLQDVNGIQQLGQAVMNLSAFDPSVRYKFDAMEAVDQLQSGLGVSASLVVDTKKAQQMAANDAKQQQMAQAMATAQQGAETAKTMSEANIDPAVLQQAANALQGATL